MTFSAVRNWLSPNGERDEGFRQEILSLSHRGLRIVGGTEIAAGLAALAGFLPWTMSLILVSLGAATLCATWISSAYPYSRLLAALSSGAGAVLSIRAMALGGSVDFALGTVAVIVLTSTSVPLLPLQALAIGLAAAAAGANTEHRVFLIMIALVETAIAAALYAQRQANHQAYQSVVQATQEFRAMQSRLMLAESSTTIVRLSAALAHELSSPVGAVSSAISTLTLLATRASQAPPSEQQRLTGLQADLVRSLNEPLDRLKKIVNRIQRLTNLDEATLQTANLNELIRDAVGLVQTDAPPEVDIQYDLKPLPPISCRPQQLIAVLCNILTNSMQALEGRGCITISTRAANSRLEVNIEDDGRGIAPEKLAHIFDPAFQVVNGRVSTGNWSLFTSRQFLKEHGGDMRIHSLEGRGTTVSLILPC